jgi:hypothetical protein
MVHPRKRFASGLDLAYLKENRGRDKSLPSIWTYVSKPLDVVIELIVGDFDSVPVEDLRPKPTYAQITSAAANDIRFCEMLFDQWMTELDKHVANRFSQPRVPSNDNDGFTGPAPRSQTIERKN